MPHDIHMLYFPQNCTHTATLIWIHKLTNHLLPLGYHRFHWKFLTVPMPVNGSRLLTILLHCTKTLRWLVIFFFFFFFSLRLVIFLKPSPLIMCLKKRYGFSKLWVQSLRSMGSECQWAKQRVAKMGFGGFQTQAPEPLWSKHSYRYRNTKYRVHGTVLVAKNHEFGLLNKKVQSMLDMSRILLYNKKTLRTMKIQFLYVMVGRFSNYVI